MSLSERLANSYICKMNPTLHITKATLADTPAIIELVNSAYRGDAARKGWTHEADLISGTTRIDAASIQEIIEKPGAVILKCLNNNDSLVGSVHLEKQDGQLYLGMLSVSPNVQAQGIGKRLLKAAEDYALQQQCRSIVMTVISARKELIDWYGRNGYMPTGERQPFPDDGHFGTPKEPLEFVVLEKVVSDK